MKRCKRCKKIIKVYRKKLCNNCYRKIYLGNNCFNCGIKIYSVSKRCKNCASISRIGVPNIKNQGKNNGMYNGGKVKNTRGYIDILIKPDVYKREHRLVMENYLGRKLKINEVVHHKNGNKEDNRLENLELFSSPNEHIQYHWDNGWKNRRNICKDG